MEAFTAVLCLIPEIDPDLKSRFQSGSRPTLNSFLLWSLPPYSPDFVKIRQTLYGKQWSGSQIFKIRPVVYEKHWSGSQIRISIRITPNFELVLPMIINSLLTKFHQNPTSSLWEILLTNKQTNRQTNKHSKVIATSRFSRENYRHILGESVNITSTNRGFRTNNHAVAT